MKRFLVALLIGSCFAQTADLRFPGGDTAGPSQMDTPAKERTVLLIWETDEKCDECSYRYAMNCSPEHPDCNTPWKTVLHYGWFPTDIEALKYANVKQVSIWGLFHSREIEVEKTSKEVHTAQPDKVETVVHYEAKVAK